MAFGGVATGNINAYEQVMTDDRTEKSIQSINKVTTIFAALFSNAFDYEFHPR